MSNTHCSTPDLPDPRDRKSESAKRGDQNDPLELEKTADRLAAEYRVGSATIKRDGQFAAAVDTLDTDRLLTGLCRAQVIAELLALQIGDGPYYAAWDCLLDLLSELIALVDAEQAG